MQSTSGSYSIGLRAVSLRISGDLAVAAYDMIIPFVVEALKHLDLHRPGRGSLLLEEILQSTHNNLLSLASRTPRISTIVLIVGAVNVV